MEPMSLLILLGAVGAVGIGFVVGWALDKQAGDGSLMWRMISVLVSLVIFVLVLVLSTHSGGFEGFLVFLLLPYGLFGAAIASIPGFFIASTLETSTAKIMSIVGCLAIGFVLGMALAIGMGAVQVD